MNRSRVFSLGLSLVVCGVLTELQADDRILLDNFLHHPCDRAGRQWTCRGSAFWVPPPDQTVECGDPEESVPEDPCTLYPDEFAEVFGGYVQLTSAASGQSGGLFGLSRTRWDNFHLTVELEFRDGNFEPGAGGMGILLIGTEGIPDVGAAGEGFGATGLGEAPTLLLTLSTDRREVGLAWSPTGFPDDEPIRYVAGPVEIAAETPFNNRQEHPAAPNRFKIELVIHGGKIQVWIRNEDLSVDRQQILEYSSPDFEPVEGWLGITGATGEAPQNILFHSVKSIELNPPAPEEPSFFRGDPNGDGSTNITDALAILQFLFQGGGDPGCTDAADIDDDGQIAITDAVRLLNHLFQGGDAPAAPGPPTPGAACGVDPTTDDELTCATYESC